MTRGAGRPAFVPEPLDAGRPRREDARRSPDPVETSDACRPTTPPLPGPEDPDASGWKPIHDTGFIAHVGPVHVRAADGAYGFRAADKHANLIGVVHGGMLMSFADRALGETAMRAAEGANCVTIQMEMQFVDTARIGNWITVAPEVVKRTGSLVFLRCEVRHADRIVGIATGVWKILRRRPASGPVPAPPSEPI